MAQPSETPPENTPLAGAAQPAQESAQVEKSKAAEATPKPPEPPLSEQCDEIALACDAALAEISVVLKAAGCDSPSDLQKK